jgi:hypothetical protein
MYQVNEDGAFTHMGKAPSQFKTQQIQPQHNYSHCSHHHGPANLPNMTPHSHSVGASPSIVNFHPSQNASLTKREELQVWMKKYNLERFDFWKVLKFFVFYQSKVFQPGWRQPTESVDDYLERMMPHALSGGTNDPTPEVLEQEDAEKEEKEERDDEETLREKREWDDWKDDNPTGSGNRIGQG